MSITIRKVGGPMGGFSNNGRPTRLVEVIDKCLKIKRKGIYETVGRLNGNEDYVYVDWAEGIYIGYSGAFE